MSLPVQSMEQNQILWNITFPPISSQCACLLLTSSLWLLHAILLTSTIFSSCGIMTLAGAHSHVFPFLHYLNPPAGFNLYWPKACVFWNMGKLVMAAVRVSDSCTSEWDDWIARIFGKVGGSQMHLPSRDIPGARGCLPMLVAHG